MRKLFFIFLLITACNLYAQKIISIDTMQGKRNLLQFMEDQNTYLVKDFTGENHQRPEMGCELSDFGSWYDVAYSGGINRFWLNSVRYQSYDQVGFNTPQDVGLFALFFQTTNGEVIDGTSGKSDVKWYPYGWKTHTLQNDLEIESMVFYTAFNTVTITAKVKNISTKNVTLTPSLLLTNRSEYDGMAGGQINGSSDSFGRLVWRNQRIGKSCKPKNYTDLLIVGSSLGTLQSVFLPYYLNSGRGKELKNALSKTWTSSIESKVASAIAKADAMKLSPGETREFSFYIAAGPNVEEATNVANIADEDFKANSISEIVTRMESDWNNYLNELPKLHNPSEEDLKLYYSSALALRTDRVIIKHSSSERSGKTGSSGVSICENTGTENQKPIYYSGSCPARGAFNLFLQSDACWALLGYLNINSDWAAGHAVPILDPVCIIMDPHFYWSMWELYSRIPDPEKQKAFAAMVYPLLKETYKVWTEQIDIDHNLLCSTPNNWDDSPRADLLFKEANDIRDQWNSWWNDWVNFSRDNFLEDPSASSQLAYGTVVMSRFAEILGKNMEATDWRKQFEKHVQAINTLWDEENGYWIVTYRHSQKDKVLTSSILYPIFTDVCRDTVQIKRVIESHILNTLEFNGQFPIPTVAYNDSRYYKQKPPRLDEEGGLWRGHIWLPEAWLIVKGLYKYGYEAEAKSITQRLINMMSHQSQWNKEYPQYASVPAEYYDSRTGEGLNIRRYSWSSAVAMDFLLGNYQNERMLGTNSERDRLIDGHVREVFDFATGKSLFHIKPSKSGFPVLRMTSTDNLPIDRSAKVEFMFSDPAGNFTGSSVYFFADPIRWSVMDKVNHVTLKPNAEGYYNVALDTQFMLVAH